MMGSEPHPLEPTDDVTETQQPSSLSSSTKSSADTDPLLSPEPANNNNNNNNDDEIFIQDQEPLDFRSNGSKLPISDPDRSHPSSDYLKISVTNPQKETEQQSGSIVLPGNTTFVTYLVKTRTNIPQFKGTDFVVRRRFRDVVRLSDRLSQRYRGYFIPPRPDKSLVESQVMQKQEFVEQRRIALEKYLRRLATHPVIRKSEELRDFLSADMAFLGDSGSGVEPRDVVQAVRGGRDLLRMFKEMKQSVSNDWVGGRPPIEEDDKDFLEKKEKLRELEQQISGTSQQAESLVKSQQRMAETMGELGLALIKLTKFENQNAVLDTQRIRAADMKNVATVTVKGSRLYRELNAQTVKHLDTLHEYLGLMLAVDAAFSDRSSALLTVQTLISDLASLNLKAGKLETASSKIFGNDKSKVHKVDELREKLSIAENAKSCAIKEYEKIKENNRNEIERLGRERKDDFVNMLKGFVINQVAYTEKVATEWSKVVENTSHYVRESG